MILPYQAIKKMFAIGLVCILLSCNGIKKQQEICASSSKEVL